jgi:hypothetical protein
MKKIIIYSTTLLTLTACNPKTTEAFEIKKTETPLPEGAIAEGNSLYLAHCGKCHDLPVISKYSKEKWQKIVPSMAKEAKLDATQENKILSFVNWKLQQQ